MIRVKICGITNYNDAQAAIAAGADSLGFNFYEKSLRRISTVEAAQIRAKLAGDFQAVAVFVNASPAEIASVRALVRFDAVQLHGDESADIVWQVARTIPVIKALRVGPGSPSSNLDAYSSVFAFLLDSARAGQYGGTGQTTDWGFAERAARAHRIFLSGGLNPQNVAAAILAVRPYAVDVASGVESKPGKKDHAKLAEFIQEVRRAERELSSQPESISQA